MIPAIEFYHALSIAVRHARTATRPDLQNIFLVFSQPDTLRVIGTDVNRMAVIELAVQHGQPDSTVVLGLADAEDLCEMLSVPVVLGISHRLSVIPFGPQIMFSFGTLCPTYPAQTADVPDWQGVMARMPDPGTAVSGVRLDARLITDALEVCQPILSETAPEVSLRVEDYKPLFIVPRLVGVTAIQSVTIAIMYRGNAK